MLVTSLIAGGYPAWLLAKQKTKQALQSGNTIGRREDTRLRKVMVIAQFVITMVIITGAITVGRQLQYIKNKDLGFQQQGVIQIKLPESGNNPALTQEWRAILRLSSYPLLLEPQCQIWDLRWQPIRHGASLK